MGADLRKCKGALIFGNATVTFWHGGLARGGAATRRSGTEPKTPVRRPGGGEPGSCCDPPVACDARDSGDADCGGGESAQQRMATDCRPIW
jgi:hypothetical protein